MELAINIYSMKSSFPQTRGLQQIPMARPVFAIGGKTMPWTKEMDPFRLGPAGNGFQLHFGHRRWGLAFDRLTLIARSATNDNLIVVLTTEDLPGLRKACDLAISQRVTEVQS